MAKTMETMSLHSNSKKGDSSACENNRTISLIVHASKILLKIIQKRLEPYLEREIPDAQGGSRKNRGTRDQIANIRRLMETTREYQKNVYMCFIDYSKAFDCVDQEDGHSRTYDNSVTLVVHRSGGNSKNYVWKYRMV